MMNIAMNAMTIPAERDEQRPAAASFQRKNELDRWYNTSGTATRAILAPQTGVQDL
jgi:hypothetical protein